MKQLALIFVAMLQAAAQCPPTSGAAISACGGTAVTCGFPGYACARSDANTLVVNSMTTVPPVAGKRSPGAGLQICVAGADGGLQSCGALYGTNTVITDPNYANVHIVRISDYSDLGTGCTPIVGPGGDASYNVFDYTDTYVVINCTGGTSRIKWLNPATGAVNTSIDPQGYVHTTAGAVWSVPTAQIRAGYSWLPYSFWYLNGTQVMGITINSGFVSDPISYADFAISIPCWNLGSIPCPDWQANHSYSPGDNIIPLTGNASPAHSFQLMNATTCTSGAAAPNWAATIALGTSLVQGVATDGACTWADMWTPNTVTWEGGFSNDTSDFYFNVALSNHGSQDGAGTCYVVVNDETSGDNYYNLNTCTGNVYSSTIGTGNFGYLGNVYAANPFSAGRNSHINIHNAQMSLNAEWVNVSFNNCALVNASGPVNCTSPVTNQYYWVVNSTRMLNALEWLGTGTPGHDAAGHFVYMHKNQSTYVSATYLGRQVPSSGVTGGTAYNWFDVSKFTCSPNTCWQAYSSTNPAMSQTFFWDQHSSWVSNTGSDNTPICTSTYNQSGPMGGQPIAQASLFPPHYPWLGEVICYATDSSNRVAREAFQWNTQSSPDFNSTFSIGSLSSSGKFWVFNSDWFCTLGTNAGAQTNTCGLPFQADPAHHYAVGEFVSAPLYNPVVASIYQVTTAGNSDGAEHGRAFWAGCTTTCTVGTVGLTYQGQANQLSSVFIVKLQ